MSLQQLLLALPRRHRLLSQWGSLRRSQARWKVEECGHQPTRKKEEGELAIQVYTKEFRAPATRTRTHALTRTHAHTASQRTISRFVHSAHPNPFVPASTSGCTNACRHARSEHSPGFSEGQLGACRTGERGPEAIENREEDESCSSFFLSSFLGASVLVSTASSSSFPLLGGSAGGSAFLAPGVDASLCSRFSSYQERNAEDYRQEMRKQRNEKERVQFVWPCYLLAQVRRGSRSARLDRRWKFVVLTFRLK